MKKANAQDEEKKGELVYDEGTLNAIQQYLVFPINAESRKAIRQLEGARAMIKDDLSSIEHHKRSIVERRARIKQNEMLLPQLEEKVKPEEQPSRERALAELEAVAVLPWVEKVWLEYPQMRINTRKDMLKTRLDTRIVDCGGGKYRSEYVAEPPIVPMPQYEINISLDNMGNGGWANNTHNLAIRLINQHDMSKFVGGKVVPHDPHPHWASGGSRGLGAWAQLCLGEYEKDLNEASKKGLVPFLSELAAYLQTCGDGHAYRRKDLWALSLGKPEYNEHILRPIANGEKVEDIEARYKRDYKTVNAVELKEGAPVNPGADGLVVDVSDVAALGNAWNIAFRPMDILYQDLVAAQGIAPLMPPCDCPASPENPYECDCDGECACHEEYVGVDD